MGVTSVVLFQCSGCVLWTQSSHRNWKTKREIVANVLDYLKGVASKYKEIKDTASVINYNWSSASNRKLREK